MEVDQLKQAQEIINDRESTISALQLKLTQAGKFIAFNPF